MRSDLGARLTIWVEHTLCISVRHCNTGGFAILVDSCPADDSSDCILVCYGFIEGLEDEDATPFATAESSASFVEGDGATRVGQEAVKCQNHKLSRR